MKKLIFALTLVAAALLGVLLWLLATAPEKQSVPPGTGGSQDTSAGLTNPFLPAPTETEPPPTEPPFTPAMTQNSDPANWNITWEVEVDGQAVESYTRPEPISFDREEGFALPGVAGFRGGSYRNEPGYGTANITQGTVTKLWDMDVGYWSDPEWVGCGWTGQPLVAQWDAETRAIMNLYPEKQAKENLTEVIYAKMDGRVHFLDMDDGTPTRDPIKLGMVFKGSGALDPRGYPILYVGSGIQEGSKFQRMFVVSLIDGSVLYEVNGYDQYAYRRWYAFDSSPLIDGETDTVIWPGESGVIYSFKLNTRFDKAAGTLSVTPSEMVKLRYKHDYYSKNYRNLGFEGSAIAVENYLYIADNAGMLFCIDLNTMRIVWAQDVLDDVNATPLFDWGEDGRGYLYLAPSLEYHNGGKRGELPLMKLDAQSGEILWSYPMVCVSPDGTSGGILASPLMGREGSDIQDLIIFSVGRSPAAWDGQMVAINKNTGTLEWQFETANYMWSSPVALYNEDGKSYIFQADASGNCYLLDGASGTELAVYKIGETVEASPVVFGNHVMLGSRWGCYLFEIN